MTPSDFKILINSLESQFYCNEVLKCYILVQCQFKVSEPLSFKIFHRNCYLDNSVLIHSSKLYFLKRLFLSVSVSISATEQVWTCAKLAQKKQSLRCTFVNAYKWSLIVIPKHFTRKIAIYHFKKRFSGFE